VLERRLRSGLHPSRRSQSRKPPRSEGNRMLFPVEFEARIVRLGDAHVLAYDLACLGLLRPRILMALRPKHMVLR
jgi:hypothetical protein